MKKGEDGRWYEGEPWAPSKEAAGARRRQPTTQRPKTLSPEFIEGVQERSRMNLNRMVEQEYAADEKAMREIGITLTDSEPVTSSFRDRKGENPYGK